MILIRLFCRTIVIDDYDSESAMDTDSEPAEDPLKLPVTHSVPKLIQPNVELLNDLLISMKRKYEEVNKPDEKFKNFMNLLSEKLLKLSDEQLDDVQLEILSLVNNKVKQSTNRITN